MVKVFIGQVFLPNKNKDAASELYSICRYFDDLADETSTDQSEKLKEEFEQFVIELSTL